MKSIIAALLLLVSVCSPLASVRAQIPETPLFRQLGTIDGLPSDHVHKLAQDRAGYLWVATSDGLARFDGVRFRVWQHDPADPASLSGNVVQSLYIDAQDQVWVGAEGGGLSLMNATRTGFRHFRAGQDVRFALADVWSIVSTPDGAIWFGGHGGGLYRYDPSRDAVQVFRHDPLQPDTLAADHVLALAVDDAGTLWIGTSAGLQRYVDGRFAGEDGLSAPLVLSLYAEPGGPLWIGTAGGLDRRGRDGRIHPLPAREQLSNAGVNAVMRDRRGTHWITTHGGLNHLVDGRIRSYLGLAGGGFALANFAVMDALEDHEGGLWFATLGSGLRRLPPSWRNFGVLVRAEAAKGGLSTGFPRGVAEARDDALWVVGAGGVLDRVERDGRVTRHLDEVPSLPEKVLWSVQEDRAGQVWIGHHSGLSRYDPVANTIRTWNAQSGADAPPAGPIDLLAFAPDGSLWLSGYGTGLQRRAADGRVEASYEAGASSGLSVGDTEAIEFAPDGALWIAGDRGLHRFDASAASFVSVPGSPATRVFGFAFEAGDTLWLQRLGALERYRFRDGRLHLIEQAGTAQGLPAVEAGGVRVDAAGDVWMTSIRGLFCYRPGSGELRHYGLRDGLPSLEFGNRPPLRTRDGAILAGTVAGLVLFDPMRLEEHRSVPRLRFETAGVRRAGAEVTLDPSQPISLRHDDRELRVAARLMSFADPQSHRYRFRLHGYERDWIDGGALGERVFSHMPPGSYTLQVVAANVDGVWSAPPLTLRIAVASPWWSTIYARVGYVIATGLALIVIGAGYRRQLKHRLAAHIVQRQHEWTRRASEAKSGFLATLGHEIRTPMTGVLGMTELLLTTPLEERQRSYAESIRDSGQLLLRLVNDALDLARIEAGRLELADAPVDLHGLLREVTEFQKPLAERKGVALTLSIDAAAPRWVRGDALRLKQILLNLGSNALKFTERGEVGFALQPAHAPYTLSLMVRDTGPGLNAEQRARLFQRFSQAEGAETARRYGGSGLGLAICQELASAMGGRIDVASEPGLGATFVLQLPLAECSPADTVRTAIAAPTAALVDATARCILLVEDDAIVAAVVNGLLSVQGHAVTHVPHGLAALTELGNGHFDLAFVDLDLPGVNGLDLARMIRAQGHALPLIALTARADPEAEPQARDAGMCVFLRKPVSGEQLAQAIGEAVGDAGGVVAPGT